MSSLERINSAFKKWYEGLFPNSEDVRPKDILRRILTALEDNRKEGFDSRVYVPNQYILEIAVDDEEEKEYLLSFLDREELESAVRRYCQQNRYHIRGALDFTIREVPASELDEERRREKVRVRCRYNSKVMAPEPAPLASPPGLPEVPYSQVAYEERTVAGAPAREDSEEMGTVASVAYAALIVYAPDRAPFRYTISRSALTIGRSPRAGNDLVIESDGQMSKRHARLELEADGRFTLYDLGSTNGVKVNGRRVENRTLHDGDELLLGETRFTFKQEGQEAEAALANDAARGASEGRSQGAFGGAAALLNAQEGPGSSSPPARVLRAHTARLVLVGNGRDVDEYLLASETTLGRAVTNDIVLTDRSIATRHARLVYNGDGYLLEALDNAPTSLNTGALAPGQSLPLKNGDLIRLGSLELRFVSEENR